MPLATNCQSPYRCCQWPWQRNHPNVTWPVWPFPHSHCCCWSLRLLLLWKSRMQSLLLLFVVGSSWRLLSLLPAKVSLGGVNQVVYRNERKILQLLLLYKDLSPLDRDSHSAERNRLTYSLCGCFRCGGYSSIGFVLCCYSVRWDHRTQWKERRESPGSGLLLGGGVTASPMLTQCNGHKRCLFFLFVRFQTNYIFPLQIRIYTYLEVDVRSQNFLFW